MNKTDTIAAVAKKLTEPLTKEVSIKIADFDEFRKKKRPVDSVLDYRYTKLQGTRPSTFWHEPNIWDCTWDTLPEYIKGFEEIMGRNSGAFLIPEVCYINSEHNDKIRNMPCMCRGGQIFVGLQTTPHGYIDENEVFYALDLFKKKDAYFCDTVFDCDDGSVCHQGQMVILKSQMQCVAGQEEKYPDIQRTVP